MNAKPFAEMFPAWEQISTEEFHRQAAVRMENTGEVAGAFDLDFDKREFSAVHIMNGWQTFSMGNVCAAAEKEVLLWKMDEYCQEQTGMTLAEYSAQLLAEAQELEVPTEPTM